MCGIAGVVDRDPRGDATALLQRLTSALAHRGPDGFGYHYARGRSIGLGHRRLSIVDLVGGAQPMSNEDARLWVVLNGEIYNHLEIRRELEGQGHVFRTRADTEVIVHGWEEYGPSILDRLNGIYALSVLDCRAAKPELWIARDPVGVKPLYFGEDEGLWWFASELGAARECGLLSADLRADAICEFLVYRFVPSPATCFHSAWKLPPGHACKIPIDGSRDLPSFSTIHPQFEPASLPATQDEWMEVLGSQLESAVRRQLMSDVPVASLLSGGVDSTLVTEFMIRGLPSPPQSFAIGFKDNTRFDELAASRAAAQSLQVPLREVAVAEEEYLRAWPSQVARFAEPIANSSTLLVGMLCREVGLTHKVALSGQGADEPLGGYPRHLVERLPWLTRGLRFVIDGIPDCVLSSDRMKRLRRISSQAEEARRFAETLAVFGLEEVADLSRHTVEADSLADPVRRWLPESQGEDSLNRLLFIDARLSLADDLLIVGDHTSMASSVEMRVPFLDLAFLSCVERMPSRYKVSVLGERKWLYRKAASTRLPVALRETLTGVRAAAGRKLGFSTPLESWFGRWIQQGASAFLTGKGALLPNVVRAESLGKVVGAAKARGGSAARQLMSLFVLETWLRSNAAGGVSPGEIVLAGVGP